MPFLAPAYRRISGAAPPEVIRVGLQSRWPMDDGSGTTVTDDQGSNDGTMGNMSEAAWVSGIGVGPLAGPYSIDFLDSHFPFAYIQCGVMVPASTTALSVCARVHPRDITQAAILDNGGTTGNLLYRLSFGSGGTVQILIGNSSGSWGKVWTTDCVPAINTTQHIGFTWDGATVLCYMNGIEDDSDSYVGSLTTSGTDNCIIGNTSSPGAAWEFNGIIDDVRVYSRALSPAEMLSISNGTG